ncbi:competence protein ComK [Ureibacillus sp. GCM10028918]|uniref:competence protein ComK n=1 Tax=Ureibacillus sp. GCM10028918 TaxID=3273429 RepID=UPI003622E04F
MTKFEEMIFKKHRILAIAPHYHESYASVIYTPQEEFYSIHHVKKNMETYCLLNGSSLDGRKSSSRKRFNDVKNPSILISELDGIAAFQVPGAERLDTIWITDVVNVFIESLPNNHTEITLSNRVKLTTPLASNLVDKRIEKALRLLHETAFIYIRNKFIINITNDINPKE